MTGHEFTIKEAMVMKRCLLAAAKSLRANEEKLNELDSGCGDGDCGSTLRRLGDGKSFAYCCFISQYVSFLHLVSDPVINWQSLVGIHFNHLYYLGNMKYLI